MRIALLALLVLGGCGDTPHVNRWDYVQRKNVERCIQMGGFPRLSPYDHRFEDCQFFDKKKPLEAK